MNFKATVFQHKWSFMFTFFLVLAEAGLAILFPLVIGFAIDDALVQKYTGSYYLGMLGFASLVIGAGRRFFDTRFYATIFEKLGLELHNKLADANASTKTARLHMLTEIVEFFENNLPQLITNSISLIGTLLILYTLNLTILGICLAIVILIIIVYGITGNRTYQYNKSFNNELEQQVNIVDKNDKTLLKTHINQLMKWNIKLSDLETFNFSIVWMMMMGALVYSIIITVNSGITQYGAIFAIIMYVFQFMENVFALPLFYQQWLRLVEISNRFKDL